MWCHARLGFIGAIRVKPHHLRAIRVSHTTFLRSAPPLAPHWCGAKWCKHHTLGLIGAIRVKPHHLRAIRVSHTTFLRGAAPLAPHSCGAKWCNVVPTCGGGGCDVTFSRTFIGGHLGLGALGVQGG